MRTQSETTRAAKILAIGSFIVMSVTGCSSNAPYQSSYSAAPAEAAPATTAAASTSAAKADSGILGVWDGTTLATCSRSLPSRCNAQQMVSITLIEGDDSKIGGYYKCSYGNMDCYHLNETGKVVDAAMNGTQISMRVMRRDGTSCRFGGRVDKSSVIGGYSCASGAAQFEQGTWRATRSY